MSTVTGTLYDVFGATADLVFVNTIYPPLRDAFGAKGRFVTQQRRDVHEVFGASGKAVHEHAYILLRDAFGVSTATTVHIIGRRTVRERFRVRDKVLTARVRYTASLTDTFGATGGFAGEPEIGTRLRDKFGARASVSSFLRKTDVVSETFGATGRAIARNVGILSDVFAAHGSSIAPAHFGYLKSVFHARSQTYPQILPRAMVREKFGARDAPLPISHILHVVSERFTAYAEARGRVLTPSITGTDLENISPRLRTDVWTADMRTWSMSRYVDFPLTDFVDTRFGAGHDGLYTSSTADLMAFVETGKLRTDDQEGRKLHHKKQPRYVYIYGVYTQPLHVMISADLNGELAQYEYQTDRADVESERASRCEIGRGFASNYLKLRIGGRSRFMISAVEIESVPSTRRV